MTAPEIAPPLRDVPVSRQGQVRRTRPTLTCERCFAVIGPERIHPIKLEKVPDPHDPGGVEVMRTTYRASCPCGTAYDIAPPPGVELDLEPQAGRTFVPKGSERNAPCPCGSGRKVKKCHREGLILK